MLHCGRKGINMDENKKKISDVCNAVLAGKLTADKMYTNLSEISETCEDDLVCIIEDCLMELDMIGGAQRNGKQSAKDCAKMVLEELENV